MDNVNNVQSINMSRSLPPTLRRRERQLRFPNSRFRFREFTTKLHSKYSLYSIDIFPDRNLQMEIILERD